MQEDDPLLAQYARTTLILVDETLARARLTGDDAATLPAERLFVITPDNPGSIALPAAFNAALYERFLDHVRRLGHRHWEVIGQSRDGEWSERGVGIADVTRSEACALGRAYRQRAVFELTDDELMVVQCDDQAVVVTRPRRT